MDAVMGVLHTLLSTLTALIAVPPRWTHAALHRSIEAYVRHAPANLPFPFDIFFGGWEGLGNADVCSRLSTFSAFSMAGMPLACDDRIYRYINGRVSVVIAVVVVTTGFSFIYKMPDAMMALLRFINPLHRQPAVPAVPAVPKKMMTPAKKAAAQAARIALAAIKREHPTLKNFTLFFTQKMAQAPKMTLKQFWDGYVLPDLKALVPAVPLDPIEPDGDDDGNVPAIADEVGEGWN